MHSGTFSPFWGEYTDSQPCRPALAASSAPDRLPLVRTRHPAHEVSRTPVEFLLHPDQQVTPTPCHRPGQSTLRQTHTARRSGRRSRMHSNHSPENSVCGPLSNIRSSIVRRSMHWPVGRSQRTSVLQLVQAAPLRPHAITAAASAIRHRTWHSYNTRYSGHWRGRHSVGCYRSSIQSDSQYLDEALRRRWGRRCRRGGRWCGRRRSLPLLLFLLVFLGVSLGKGQKAQSAAYQAHRAAP